MATYSKTNQFEKDWVNLGENDKKRFRQLAPGRFNDAIDEGPPYPADLRMVPMTGWDDVRELRITDSLRATWEFGEAVREDKKHVVWRRIGNHDIYRSP